MRADIYLEWAVWFAESHVDPLPFSTGAMTYGEFVARVRDSVAINYPFMNETNRKSLAEIILKLSTSRAESYRESHRTSIADRDRKVLLECSGVDRPRCAICGFSFPDEAIARFLKESSRQIKTPLYVDYLMPRGVRVADLLIEVDHVVPVARGGNIFENLQLCCGWCNRHKGAKESLYEVAGATRRLQLGGLSISSPQPFWVVRSIGAEGKCTDCGATTTTRNLRVALKSDAGTANPWNLKVVCDEHDPSYSSRLVPVSLFKNRFMCAAGSSALS